MTAAMIVPCKGRLEHLKLTLPTMVSQHAAIEYQVVVVDYGCPDGAFQWCRGVGHPRLRAIMVKDDTGVFNLSRARNIGATHNPVDILCFVDADCRLRPSFLDAITGPILAGEADANVCPQWAIDQGYAGTCAVLTELYHRVHGYDEGLEGWGYEDLDFYARLRATGRPVAEFAAVRELVHPVMHGDELRVQFYERKDKWASLGENMQRAGARSGPVNPNGYGIARIALWTPDASHAVPEGGRAVDQRS